MKKTITICDICKREDDEDVEATDKCIICKKDVCDDCWINYELLFGEENEYEDNIDWIICKDCLDKVNFDKHDKPFLDKLEKDFLKHLKDKVMLGELIK